MHDTLDRWREALDRLTDKSGGPDACWLWLGSKNQGYGTIYIDGADRRVTRMALMCSGTALADSDNVCHRCNNPPCLNPTHLYAGSHKMNMRDLRRSGRAFRPDGRYLRSLEHIKRRQARHETWEEAHQIDASDLLGVSNG